MIEQQTLKQFDRNADIDPNVLQRSASDPDACVWVAASAGTGKTKVLTDRVLRLLLPRRNGLGASAAHKVLCLTFTKAAASEMALRISKYLARWAVISNDELECELEKLTGDVPSIHQIKAARRLFADVVDVPGGLKIMTIHSFCQSVLGRFPLESDLSPNFKVLEGVEMDALLLRARQDVFAKYAARDGVDGRVLQRLAQIVNEEQFSALLSSIVSERNQFSTILKRNFGVDGMYEALCKRLSVPAEVDGNDVLYQSCQDDAFDVSLLRSVARAMVEQGNKTDQKNGAVFAHWLSLDASERSQKGEFDAYMSVFLKKDGDVRVKFCGKAVVDLIPDAADIMQREAERLIALRDKMLASRMAKFTRDVCALSLDITEWYNDLKIRQGVLDFDDLIFKTLELLKTRAPWVQFKLDQGIDHILVDEAQDTNPEQWEIIEALCDDFFDGMGAVDTARTIFVVGDEKQSIYSFQRASPEAFDYMRKKFAQRVRDAGGIWREVDLNVSFRSTRSVLSLVDQVFSLDDVRRGLGGKIIEHYAFRGWQAGLCELWPLFESDDVKEGTSLWDVPSEVQKIQSGGQKAADALADAIKNWIDGGDVLPSHGCSICAGDIMILVRKRGAFVAQISRALKTRGVAVGGVDRMVLGDQLVVQDLLALMRFSILPRDDYSLACVLKSPFIGFDDDALFDVAYQRAGDLWSRIKELCDENIVLYLREIVSSMSALGPYDFLERVLQMPCPADEVSGRRAIMSRLGVDAMDALDEFMNVALDFQFRESGSLQHFVFEQERAFAEIKREQEGAGNYVRIMTVHGSKGLQAPIVILPDTVSTVKPSSARMGDKFLWPDKTGLELPVCAPNKNFQSAVYKEAAASVHARLDDEYRRLLYVAMTRAEDRLYVCGVKGKSDPADGCWYHLVRRGLMACDGVECLDDGVIRYEHSMAEDVKPDRDSFVADSAVSSPVLPQWLFEHAAVEYADDNVLQPSRLEEVAFSPVQGHGEQRFLRGNLTHKLLQILPDISRDKWQSAATNYLSRYGDAFSDAAQADIVREALEVLDHPEFSVIFATGSQAEVPVSGYIDGKGLVSAQIDRLAITDECVYIIDYKTNRPPPTDIADIPDIYRRQLNIYRDLMRSIYPDKAVRAALLWTDGPFLTVLPD